MWMWLLMANDNDTLQNGTNFYDYHKDNMKNMSGFNISKGSNFDKFIKSIDGIYFNSSLNLDEQDKAHDINYAHGLELDDIGDNYELNRNGLDDDTYRFLIKSHIYASRSKGSIKDLISITSNLLGCKPTDVHLDNSRVYLNGQLNDGLVNTVEIKGIDINTIQHANLIPYLVKELKNATATGYTINQIGFAVNSSGQIFTGGQISISKEISI